MSNKYNEYEILTKMAQHYDDQGDEKSAQLLDTLITTRFAAEKEEKESGRSMSGKAKAKFRAVQKAAQSLCAADLDYRGPNKKECRKVEMLCEDILEALEDCDLG